MRLTGSGLGCPTWPRCTDESFVPHRALGMHGVIEFGNRMFTYVLVAVAVGTLIAVWRWAGSSPAARRLAVVLALGIPFQGVIGGITVLTDLNPWIVSLHLLLSMVLIGGSVLLVVLVRGAGGTPVPARSVALTRLTFAALIVVVYLGTVVTGSGPHAGDADSPRNGLDPHVMSHVHASSVYVLRGPHAGHGRRAPRHVGRAVRGDPARRRAAAGHDRLRPVLHRPAGRPGGGPPRRRRDPDGRRAPGWCWPCRPPTSSRSVRPREPEAPGWRARRIARQPSASGSASSSTNPHRWYRRMAVSLPSSTRSHSGRPAAAAMTRPTSARPTPRPRADGATHMEISCWPSSSSFGRIATRPTGAAPCSATKSGPGPASRERQFSSRSWSPVQRSTDAANACGSSVSERCRSRRQTTQSSGPTSRTRIVTPASSDQSPLEVVMPGGGGRWAPTG